MSEHVANEYDPYRRNLCQVETLEGIQDLATHIYIQANTLEPVVDVLRDLANGKDKVLEGLATIVENFQRFAIDNAESIENSLVRMKAERTEEKEQKRQGLPTDPNSTFVFREIDAN